MHHLALSVCLFLFLKTDAAFHPIHLPFCTEAICWCLRPSEFSESSSNCLRVGFPGDFLKLKNAFLRGLLPTQRIVTAANQSSIRFQLQVPLVFDVTANALTPATILSTTFSGGLLKESKGLLENSGERTAHSA